MTQRFTDINSVRQAYKQLESEYAALVQEEAAFDGDDGPIDGVIAANLNLCSRTGLDIAHWQVEMQEARASLDRFDILQGSCYLNEAPSLRKAVVFFQEAKQNLHQAHYYLTTYKDKITWATSMGLSGELPPKLEIPTRDDLLANANGILIELKQHGGTFADTSNYGEFFLNWDLNSQDDEFLNAHTHSEWETLQTKLGEAASKVHTKNNLSFKNEITAMVDILFDQGLDAYRKGCHQVLDFLEGPGSNCVAQTKILLASIKDHVKLPANQNLYVQIFDEHMQVVIYDDTLKTAWEPLTGKTQFEIEAPLYDPRVLYIGLLEGMGYESPLTQKSLKMIEADIPQVENASDYLTSVFTQNPESEKASTDPLALDGTGYSYSDGPVPETATLEREELPLKSISITDELTVELTPVNVPSLPNSKILQMSEKELATLVIDVGYHQDKSNQAALTKAVQATAELVNRKPANFSYHLDLAAALENTGQTELADLAYRNAVTLIKTYKSHPKAYEDWAKNHPQDRLRYYFDSSQESLFEYDLGEASNFRLFNDRIAIQTNRLAMQLYPHNDNFPLYQMIRYENLPVPDYVKAIEYGEKAYQLGGSYSILQYLIDDYAKLGNTEKRNATIKRFIEVVPAEIHDVEIASLRKRYPDAFIE